MSRFVHGIMYRAFDYKMMDKFGEYAIYPASTGWTTWSNSARH